MKLVRKEGGGVKVLSSQARKLLRLPSIFCHGADHAYPSEELRCDALDSAWSASMLSSKLHLEMTPGVCKHTYFHGFSLVCYLKPSP